MPVHLKVHSASNVSHSRATFPQASNSVLRLDATRSFLKALGILTSSRSSRSQVFDVDIHETGLSRARPTSQTQETIFLPYSVPETSSDRGDKEASRLHSNTIKYNIGKISLTVWSLFQCQCYRYNTNVPVRRRNSNGMPRSKPGSGNKRRFGVMETMTPIRSSVSQILTLHMGKGAFVEESVL